MKPGSTQYGTVYTPRIKSRPQVVDPNLGAGSGRSGRMLQLLQQDEAQNYVHFFGSVKYCQCYLHRPKNMKL